MAKLSLLLLVKQIKQTANKEPIYKNKSIKKICMVCTFL